MRLSDAVAFWEVDNARVVGSTAEALTTIGESSGLTISDESDTLLTAIGRARSDVAIPMDELIPLLHETAPSNLLLLLAGDIDSSFPLTLLAERLAEAGLAISGVVELGLQELNAVVVAHRSLPRPTALAGDIRLTESPDHISAERTREVFNLWQLYRFFGTKDLRRRGDTRSDGGPNTDTDAVLRERSRVEAEFKHQFNKMLERTEQTEAKADDLRRTLAATRSSRSYLAGRLAAESFRRPAQAAKIAKKLVSPKPELENTGSKSPLVQRQPSSFFTNAIPRSIHRRAPRLGDRGPSVMMVASRSRRLNWSRSAVTHLPMPGEALRQLVEEVPELLIIEASALTSGPWSGIGRGEEFDKAMELIHLIDGAGTLGIPTVFIWDVPTSVAPGAGQIARTCDVAVKAAPEASPEDLAVVPPGFDVHLSARRALETGRPAGDIMSFDPAVSLPDRTIQICDPDQIRHGTRHDLETQLLWLGAIRDSGIAATALARGTAIVGATNTLRVRGWARTRDIRRLPREEIGQAITEVIDDAWAGVHDNQRRLFHNHSVGKEISRIAAVAGVDVQAATRKVGILVLDLVGADDGLTQTNEALAAGAPAVAQWVGPKDGSEIRVALNLHDQEVVRVSDLREIAGVGVDSWLTVAKATDPPPVGLLDDAIRLRDYGYESIAFTESTGTWRYAVIDNSRPSLEKLTWGMRSGLALDEVVNPQMTIRLDVLGYGG